MKKTWLPHFTFLAVLSPYLTFLGLWHSCSYLSSLFSLSVSISVFVWLSLLLNLWCLIRETDTVHGHLDCSLCSLAHVCPASPVLTISWQHLSIKPVRIWDLPAVDESFICSVYLALFSYVTEQPLSIVSLQRVLVQSSSYLSACPCSRHFI